MRVMDQEWIDSIIDAELPLPFETDSIGKALIKLAARFTAAVMTRALADDPPSAQRLVEQVRREAVRAAGYDVVDPA